MRNPLLQDYSLYRRCCPTINTTYNLFFGDYIRSAGDTSENS